MEVIAQVRALLAQHVLDVEVHTVLPVVERQVLALVDLLRPRVLPAQLAAHAHDVLQ